MYRPQAVSKTSGTVFPNTDLPSGEEHIDIFSRSTKAIVFIIHVYEQLTVCSVGCFLLSVLWYDLKNRKRVSFPCNSHKILSHLELNFKRRLIVLDVRFKNWGIWTQLTVCSVGCFLLSVLWYDLKNRKRVSFPCNSHKILSHLELNFKRRLIVLDVRFKNWGISLR